MQQTETTSGSAAAWLREFEDRHGRPLRVLHIGNIANNAYINAKIQRRAGIEADVCCHDYYHVMGCPEWEDADFQGDVGDQFSPDWWAVDLHGFRRPPWFAQGKLRTCQRYLAARSRGDTRLQRLLWRQLRLELWLRCRSTARAQVLATLLGVHGRPPPERPASAPTAIFVRRSFVWWCSRAYSGLLRRLRTTLRRTGLLVRAAPRKLRAALRAVRTLVAGRGWRTALLTTFPLRLATLAVTEEHRAIVRAAALAPIPGPVVRLYVDSIGSDDDLPEDFLRYLDAIPGWKQLFRHYDVIQAYALDPVLPLLAGTRNYTAYEHGTLRDIPFREDSDGRVCAVAYRAAPAVFVTNSDVIPAARRLGLGAEQLVFLPHAVDSDRLLRFADENAALRPRPGEEIVFLSPTRHDWFDADPVWAKGNDRLIRALGLLRDEGLPCRLVLFEWGRHVAESKSLIEELGLTDRVTWRPTARKRELWARYLSAHAVVDQFLTPAMGSVAFESLALGCRVVTALDEPTVTQFFGEMPPVLEARDPVEIAAAMRRVIDDPLDQAGVGEAGQDWFRRRHSTERIIELQVATYARLVETDVSPRPSGASSEQFAEALE